VFIPTTSAFCSSCQYLSRNLRHFLSCLNFSFISVLNNRLPLQIVRQANPFLDSSDHHLMICWPSKSRRTITPLRDVALEIIMYGCSVPIHPAISTTYDVFHSPSLCLVSGMAQLTFQTAEVSCSELHGLPSSLEPERNQTNNGPWVKTISNFPEI